MTSMPLFYNIHDCLAQSITKMVCSAKKWTHELFKVIKLFGVIRSKQLKIVTRLYASSNANENGVFEWVSRRMILIKEVYLYCDFLCSLRVSPVLIFEIGECFFNKLIFKPNVDVNCVIINMKKF